MRTLTDTVKTKIVENIECLPVLLIAFSVLFFYISALTTNAQESQLSFKDNISKIEEALGDYSGFYIIVTTDTEGLTHNISSINIDDSHMILYLPDSVDKSNVILEVYTIWDSLIGVYFADFTEDKVFHIKNTDITLQTSDLQFVFIDIEKEALERVNASNRDGAKKEKAPALISTNDNSTLNQKVTIKPRGNTSWNLYKKLPYSIKFEERSDYFRLGKDKKWNLLANASDKTLVKDRVFFDLADRLGLSYTPQAKSINLCINNDWVGIYTVTSKVDGGINRVPLDPGDYLINIGSPNADNKIYFDCDYWLEDCASAKKRSFYEMVWPESRTKGFETASQSFFQEFTDVLEYRKEGRLSDYIDLESFAKYYWIQEISMNADAFSRSFYCYYKASKGRLYAGPVWDFEWALGTKMDKGGLYFTEPEGWKIRNLGIFEALFKHPEFVDMVNEVYNTYDISTLMQESYSDYSDMVSDLSVEGELNYRVHEEENNFFDLIDNGMVGNYREFSDVKLNFYKQRIEWISREMHSVTHGFNRGIDRQDVILSTNPNAE